MIQWLALGSDRYDVSNWRIYYSKIISGEARWNRVSGPLESNLSWYGGTFAPVSADFEEAKGIKDLVQKDILVSMLGENKNTKETSTFELDTDGEEVRPTPYGEFESVWLGDNSM